MHDYMHARGLRDIRRLPVAESGDTLVGALVPEPTPYGMLRVGARGRHVITIELKGRGAHIALADNHSINSAHDAGRICGARRKRVYARGPRVARA
jgi:hypothetical protein